MDRDRYKRQLHEIPTKRSINNGERPHRVAPVQQSLSAHPGQSIEAVVDEVSSQIAYRQSQPVVPAKTHPVSLPPQTPIDQIKKVEKPLLFDEDDEDIFGVWKTQKEIKKARKAEEFAAKQAKQEAKRVAKAHKRALKEAGVPREIAVSIKVPRAKKIAATLRAKYNPNHKKLYITSAVLMLLPIVASSAGLVMHSRQTGKGTDVLGQKTAVAKPDFATIKPTTTENQATALKYDTEKKLASYNDVLGDVAITVSQQPLPEGFKADPTISVENLAKQMNATDKISASDTTAFAGVSIKGPQTVIFTKNDLLIFIIADKKIDVLTWSKYIESMR